MRRKDVDRPRQCMEFTNVLLMLLRVIAPILYRADMQILGTALHISSNVSIG